MWNGGGPGGHDHNQPPNPGYDAPYYGQYQYNQYGQPPPPQYQQQQEFPPPQHQQHFGGGDSYNVVQQIMQATSSIPLTGAAPPNDIDMEDNSYDPFAAVGKSGGAVGYDQQPPPPPPPTSSSGGGGDNDAYDPFEGMGGGGADGGQAPPPPPPTPPPPQDDTTRYPDGTNSLQTTAAAEVPPPPPPPPPPPANIFSNADGNFVEAYKRMMETEKEREDAEFKAMEAKLQAEKDAHAKRIAAENNKRKAIPAVVMRKAGVGMKSRPVSRPVKVFSTGDSSDEEEDANAKGADQATKKGSTGGGNQDSNKRAAEDASGSSQVASTTASRGELTESVKETIRKTAEWILKNPNKEHIIKGRSRTDPKLSFLHEKNTPEAEYYEEVLEEHRVKEKVRLVSSGLDEAPPPQTLSGLQLQVQQAQAAAQQAALRVVSQRVSAPNASSTAAASAGWVLSSSSTTTNSRPAAPSDEAAPIVERKAKRNRWGPGPGEVAATSSGSAAAAASSSPPAGGMVASPSTAATALVKSDAVEGGTGEALEKYMPTVMDSAAEKQLKEQKKMQMLEQRIRDAARAELGAAKKAREVELFKERAKQYEELAECDEEDFRDTVEMAEETGGIIEGGTWEHRKRAKEMLKTAEKALEATLLNKGKHHIAQFLPEEELEKFLKNADSVTTGKGAIESEDFEKHKLDSESNIGMQMLQQGGWKEGEGLGTDKEGIAAPLNMQAAAGEAVGVGVEASHEVEENDDAFDQYRKRMMLAYRFRPNPLNNPRRSYY